MHKLEDPARTTDWGYFPHERERACVERLDAVKAFADAVAVDDVDFYGTPMLHVVEEIMNLDEQEQKDFILSILCPDYAPITTRKVRSKIIDILEELANE